MKGTFKCISVCLAFVVFLSSFAFPVFSNEIKNDVEANLGEEPISVTASSIPGGARMSGISGVFFIQNKVNGYVITNSQGRPNTQTKTYTSATKLFRLIPYSGSPVIGSGYYLIESVYCPGCVLTWVPGDSTMTISAMGAFPLTTMIWELYHFPTDNTFAIVSCYSQNMVLSSSQTADTGYTTYVIAYNSANQYLRWRLIANYSWYSQIIPQPGWQKDVYYNADSSAISLSSLKYENSLYEEFVLSAINRGGCHLCSMAMIMANMDMYTKTSEYDVRRGMSLPLFADPYVLAMANLRIDDWSIAADGTINGTFNDPMNAVDSHIKEKFSVNIQRIYEGNSSSQMPTALREKAQFITDKLEEHPEGIILRFSNHSIVVISSTYTSTTATEDIDDSFVVFDPGTSVLSRGNHVPLSETGRSIDDVRILYVLSRSTT